MNQSNINLSTETIEKVISQLVSFSVNYVDYHDEKYVCLLEKYLSECSQIVENINKEKIVIDYLNEQVKNAKNKYELSQKLKIRWNLLDDILNNQRFRKITTMLRIYDIIKNDL